jgi:Ricin-type beta-trefoil lectin domain/Putative Ig domain
MRTRKFFAVAVTAGLAVFGLAAAAPAATTHTATSGRHLPHAQIVHLHKAYSRDLQHVKLHKKVILPPIGAHLPRVASKRACTEPDHCNLVYHGGQVEHSVKLYLLLWGPNWESDPSQSASASYLRSFYSGLGVQPEDTWSTITDQYGDGTGRPSFNGSVFAGTFEDTSTPPSGATQAQLAAESDAFDSAEGIAPGSTNVQVVVATQSGTCPSGFACGGSGSYCAWHSDDDNSVPFTNLPYMLDAGFSCGEDFVSAQDDGFSMVGGHEYAETITDPYPDSGWWDPSDPYGGEIGDKCAWGGSIWGGSDPYGDVNLATGSFAMQSLYSNANTGCIMSMPQQTDKVTITSPGAQSSFQNSRLNLQIHASSSGGFTLSYVAAGLPTGLTINASTGLISGQVTAATGTYVSKVTVTDTNGQKATKSFNWTVKLDVGSPVKNVSSAKCVNDNNGWVTPGNPVVLWTCVAGGPNEKFSHPANPGELVVFGQCLTDPGGGGNGTALVIQPCTGASNQIWDHKSNLEYVLSSNALCLTDPNGSTINGTQAQVRTCQNLAYQHWNGS